MLKMMEKKSQTKREGKKGIVEKRWGKAGNCGGKRCSALLTCVG